MSLKVNEGLLLFHCVLFPCNVRDIYSHNFRFIIFRSIMQTFSHSHEETVWAFGNRMMMVAKSVTLWANLDVQDTHTCEIEFAKRVKQTPLFKIPHHDDSYLVSSIICREISASLFLWTTPNVNLAKRCKKGSSMHYLISQRSVLLRIMKG